MSTQTRFSSRLLLFAALMLLLCLAAGTLTQAQTETTGAFKGQVVDDAGAGLEGATVQATNIRTGVQSATKTNSSGTFTLGLLPPGEYRLVITAQGYQIVDPTEPKVRRLIAVDATTVIPDPFVMKKAVIPTATPMQPVVTGTPIAGATPEVVVTASPTPTATATDSAEIAIDINRRNARRGGVFTDVEVSTLPLGATTLTRSFDELALLLPGVAPPPQTEGNIAGPGVGPGVGSSGQFAVNGLRSRSNNFTVDGSDNNDEDIGVRRQGFFALVPQSPESIQEYQVTTLLAPAQYGRNIGAQVNAVSKSGGNDMHGIIYGFFNASQLNARNPFDFVGANTTIPLQGRVLNADRQTLGAFRNVFVNGVQRFETNNSGRENSFTLGQGGFVLGGPLIRSDVDNYGEKRAANDKRSLFYFISAEGQVLNANKESSFAVPTVEERGIFRTGATGVFFDPLFPGDPCLPGFCQAFPTTVQGDAIFSLFPFPNNPNGVYGRNTFTSVLPADAEGKIISGKINGNFTTFGKPQEFVARYNYTDDWRDIPVTGGAVFSSLRPRVKTQNFSTFLNTNLSGLNSSAPILNQLRASYGRTRLVFDEVRDNSLLTPSGVAATLPPSQQSFLLNGRTFVNNTFPGATVVSYDRIAGSIEQRVNPFGSGRPVPIGQVNIAGFSPVGVDVFNFPQRRVNNTYQLADTVTTQVGNHSLVFGVDARRTELNSDLPRNSRPLLTFNALPNIVGSTFGIPERRFFTGADFAAASAPTGVFQSLNTGVDAKIELRYYQLNFFGQDEWRIRRNLSLSYGLRYEYNTVPQSANNKIENALRTTLPTQISGLAQFVRNRTSIFDADKNNFAPRVGLAWSPEIFKDRVSVIRLGAGIYFDQILGAVVSQSRNIFPFSQNVNFAGFTNQTNQGEFTIFTPGTAFVTCPGLGQVPLIQNGTLNTINPAIPQSCFVSAISNTFVAAFPGTIPAKRLDTPTAYQYTASFEQQIGRGMVLSAAYVGTMGRHLLRQQTPNLGTNALVFVNDIFPFGGNEPLIFGDFRSPGTRFNTTTGVFSGGRPIPNIGGVTLYTTDANSRYDALQLQLRGRWGLFGTSSQFQASYTFSNVEDDVSDIFDLAGAPALPQNSLTFAGERAPANFDARHRFSYNYISDMSKWGKGNAFLHFIFNDLQIAGDGFFQTGQPFTVNTIFDINLDGNLTDRLNTTTGIQVTGDRGQPLRLTTADPFSLLAPIGQDGAVRRNSFRAGNIWLSNAAIIKNFRWDENEKALSFRMDIFNVFNRANYGVPVRFLEFPGFGRATETVTTSRRIQFAVKYSF
jgi:hypothetical protein